MRTLLGWTFKATFVAMLYLAMTSGMRVQLPETVLGYKVPEQAQQWVDRTAQISEYGKQAQSGFNGIAAAFK